MTDDIKIIGGPTKRLGYLAREPGKDQTVPARTVVSAIVNADDTEVAEPNDYEGGDANG